MRSNIVSGRRSTECHLCSPVRSGIRTPKRKVATRWHLAGKRAHKAEVVNILHATFPAAQKRRFLLFRCEPPKRPLDVRCHHQCLGCDHYSSGVNRKSFMGGTIMIRSLVISLACATFQLNSFAGDCQSRQLPDGTWTTDCPSESPNAPPAQIPQTPSAGPAGLYACYSSAGKCPLNPRSARIGLGAACTCQNAQGVQFSGTVGYANGPSSR